MGSLCRLLLAPALVVLAAGGAAADVTAGEGQAVVKGQVQELLGPGRTVRDYAPFETERGEGALLVLVVSDAREAEDEPLPETPTCNQMVDGVPLTGVYHVALVVRGALVNVVPIPASAAGDEEGPRSIALPQRNRAEYNARYWGQPVAGDPAAIEPTRLVRLADYDGDGNAWEFRLVRPHACDHVETLLAGYSPRQRKAVLFPVADGDRVAFWVPDLFPAGADTGSRRLARRWGCEQGTGTRGRTKFRFDPRRDAWVAVGTRAAPCPAAS